MDDVEVKTTEKTPSFHFIPEVFSHLLSTMTPSSLTKCLLRRRDKQRLMTDIPLSKLFFLLERQQPLNTISRQVQLSETIELIRGTIVSDDIRQYRGLLLNIERAMIYFYLFYWIFRFFENYNAARKSFEGYSSFLHIFESLWQLKFPWGLIRPEAILQSFPLSKIPEIRKIIVFQQTNAWQIGKCIERKTTIKAILKGVKILS